MNFFFLLLKVEIMLQVLIKKSDMKLKVRIIGKKN